MSPNFPQRGDRKKTTGLFSARGVSNPYWGSGGIPRRSLGKIRIGIDIGGTNTKIGFVQEGRILKIKTIPTNQEPELAIKSLTDALREMSSGIKIESIGIGCAGLIDHKEGIVRTPPNLPKWHNLKLKERLEKILNISVFVGNDANACALGEYLFGLGKGKRNIFVLTIGTGVGAGIIADGKLILGGNHSAGEFGHIIIFPKGRRCRCGNRGCLEAYIGQENIRRMAKRITSSDLTPKEVTILAKKGNKKAIEVIEKVGYYLGIGLVNICHLFDPEIIIIGGGISGMGERLLKKTRETIKERIMPLPKRRLEIKISRLGPSAGILGATKFQEFIG